MFAACRRWLQFSLQGFLVVLTIGCVWLGTMARKRGRAIDAILQSGGDSFSYAFMAGRLVPNGGVFWLDLNPAQIDIA